MQQPMRRFEAGLDGVTFRSHGARLLGGFYKAAGNTPRPTAVLLHGLPGIEKHLDIAYRLRDLGWNCLYFHFRGCWGSQGRYSLAGLVDDTRAAVDWIAERKSVDSERIALIAGSTGSHPGIVLARGPLDIPYPVNSQQLTPDAVLLPMNGWDTQGYRLGYGGGFFDRTLAALEKKPLTIGISHEMAKLDTIDPQPWDVPMDYVVTERGVYRRDAEGLVFLGQPEAIS